MRDEVCDDAGVACFILIRLLPRCLLKIIGAASIVQLFFIDRPEKRELGARRLNRFRLYSFVSPLLLQSLADESCVVWGFRLDGFSDVRYLRRYELHSVLRLGVVAQPIVVALGEAYFWTRLAVELLLRN